MDLAQVPIVLTGRRARLRDFRPLTGPSSEDGSVPLYITPLPEVDVNINATSPQTSIFRPRWELRPQENIGGHSWQVKGSIIGILRPSNQNNILPYTDEQYERIITTLPSSIDWDRAETDYLFQQCARFHNRLAVVHAHYDYCALGRDEKQTRPLEDLRERYWQVKQALLPPEQQTPHFYNKEADRRQRMLREEAERQSGETVMLEESMVNMRLALPQVIPRRERLLLLVGGMGQHLLAHCPTLPELCSGMPIATGTSATMGSTKMGHSTGESIKKHATASGTTKKAVRKARPSSGSLDRKKRSLPSGETSSPLATSEEDEDEGEDHGDEGDRKYSSTHRRSRPSTTSTSSFATSGTGPGRKPKPVLASVSCRSQNLRPIRVGLTRHVDKLLFELGLPLKPSMPTLAVCERFDELRMLLARLGELQKNVTGGKGTTFSLVTTPLVSPTLRTTTSSGASTGVSSRKSSRSTSPAPSTSAPITSTSDRPAKRHKSIK